MKFFLTASALALLALIEAKTDYVTRYHYITVDSSGKTIGANVVFGEPAQSTEASQDVFVTAVQYEDTTPVDTTSALTIETSSPSLIELDVSPEGSPTVKSPTASTVVVTSQSRSRITTVTSGQTSVETTSKTQATISTDTSDSGIYSEISSSGVDADFAKAILDAHNQKREAHSASDLSWSTTLYEYAQNYADSYTCGSSLVHSGGDYGENLAYGYASGVTALEAWYDEGSDYDFSSATTLNHFTQVIWQSTTELGCAYKSCSGGLYVICSYNPAGNFVGEGLANLSAD